MQAWGGLILREPWRTVRSLFGMNLERVISGGVHLPKYARFRDQQFFFNGWGFSEQGTCEIRSRELIAKILVAAPNEEASPLVFSRQRKTFVNGKALHAEFSYVLAAGFAKRERLRQPYHGLVVWGPPVYRFALQDTTLNYDRDPKTIRMRILRRDSQTGLITETVEPQTGQVQIKLRRHEFFSLITIDP